MTKIPYPFKFEKQVWSLAGSIGLLLASYIVLVGMTVHNTFLRQTAEKQISSLTAELSEMEFSFLSIKAGINADLALSLGFVESDTVVIARKGISETAFVRNDNT